MIFKWFARGVKFGKSIPPRLVRSTSSAFEHFEERLTPANGVTIETGGNGNDAFNVTPSATIIFTLDGGPNRASGDQLNYLASNLPVRVAPGKFTANFRQDVNFEDVEKLNLDNAAGVNWSEAGMRSTSDAQPTAWRNGCGSTCWRRNRRNRCSARS